MKQYQIERIKNLLEAKGMTNQELAFKCDISAMTVSRILTKPDYDLLRSKQIYLFGKLLTF